MESISLVEDGQQRFYTENIPFSSSIIFSSSPTPKLASCVSPRHKTFSASGVYNHAKMPHPDQSHNVVIYMCTDVKHNSWLGRCKFDLPNRPFLSPWSHFTRQTYSCMLWATAYLICLATETNMQITQISIHSFLRTQMMIYEFFKCHKRIWCKNLWEGLIPPVPSPPSRCRSIIGTPRGLHFSISVV